MTDAGGLVLCPTPIGNLGDITLRALDALRRADVVLAEDTRRTLTLLRHHGIAAELQSYHEHNEEERTPWALERLRQGACLVLVSDAGTPGIADPGFRLVRAAIDQGIPVTALPGASALLPALTLSGLPTHRFAFYGFVPRPARLRRAAVRAALDLPLTSVWYESPQRLPTTLRDMVEAGYGERAAAVARELTKVYEEVRRGSVAELAQYWGEAPPRGEIVLCVGPAPAAPTMDVEDAVTEVLRLVGTGASLPAATAAVAHRGGLSRRRLYAEAVGRRDRGGPSAGTR